MMRRHASVVLAKAGDGRRWTGRRRWSSDRQALVVVGKADVGGRRTVRRRWSLERQASGVVGQAGLVFVEKMGVGRP